MKTSTLLILLLMQPRVADGQTLDQRRDQYLNIDQTTRVLSPALRLSAADTRVPMGPSTIGAVHARMKLISSNTTDWTVVVESSDGTYRRLFTAAAFLGGEVWTPPVPGGTAVLRLLPDGASAVVEVNAYTVQQKVELPQGIIGLDDSKYIDDPAIPPGVRKWASAVGRLLVMTPKGRGTCTTFLVGVSLAITNQHCIASPGEAAQSWVEFGADSSASIPVTVEVTELIDSDQRLDYSLIRLAGSPGLTFGRLYLSHDLPSPGASLIHYADTWTVQHPRGERKKVAFPPNCSRHGELLPGVDGALNDVGHTCDTRTGSSGAPLLDVASGLVVGLHHWDVDPKSPKNKQVNQAIQVGLLLKNMRRSSAGGVPAVPPPIVEEVQRVQQ